MADVAAVLDTTGMAGHVAGKKGKVGAHDSKGFMVALMSQLAASNNGKTKAGALPGVSEAAKGKAEQALSEDAVAALRADKPETALSKAGDQETGQEAETAPNKPLDASEAPLDAAVQTVIQAQAASASANAAAIPIDRSAADAKGAQDGDTDASDLKAATLDARESKGANRTANAQNQPERPASTAGKEGNDGQDLPVAAPGESSQKVAVVPSEASVKTVAPQASVTGTGGTHPAADQVAARPFEHTLRQAEARLNMAVESPVKSPGFAGEFADKVVWMAGRQGQIAELSLNPPQMGSVEVRLTVSGGEAGAQFFSANPAVREALEAALPKLREMMAQAGLNLGDANVRDQSLQQDRSGAQAGTRVSDLTGDGDGMSVSAGVFSPRASGVGLVDLYA